MRREGLKIKIKGTNDFVAYDVREARTMRQRMLGLMFSKDIPLGDGLLLSPCNSIHTFFMKYPIDVLFLDKNGVVLRIYKSLLPWRVTPIILKARKVLELRAGTLRDEIKIGTTIEVENV